jgi:hypothetical protein
MRASSMLAWERTVKQTGSVPSSAIRSVLERILRSVRENILAGILVAYSECTW